MGPPPRRHRPLPQGEPAHKEQRAPCRGRWAERPPNERTQNRARDPPWEQSHCRGHWLGGDHTRQGGPTAITTVFTGRGTAGRRHMGRGCVATEAETGWCAYKPGGAKDGRRPPGAGRRAEQTVPASEGTSRALASTSSASRARTETTAHLCSFVTVAQQTCTCPLPLSDSPPAGTPLRGRPRSSRTSRRQVYSGHTTLAPSENRRTPSANVPRATVGPRARVQDPPVTQLCVGPQGRQEARTALKRIQVWRELQITLPHLRPRHRGPPGRPSPPGRLWPALPRPTPLPGHGSRGNSVAAVGAFSPIGAGRSLGAEAGTQ